MNKCTSVAIELKNKREHYLKPESGLFSLLPPPKNTSVLKKPGFVPYVLSSKKKASLSAPPKSTTKPTETQSFCSGVLDEQNYDGETSCNEESSKDDADSSTCKDFFSLDSLDYDYKLHGENSLAPNSGLRTDPSSAALETSNFTQSRTSSLQSSTYIKQINESAGNPNIQPYHPPADEVANFEQNTTHDEQLDSSVNYYIDPVTNNSYRESMLKDKEFLKLQGRRREFEAVDIIDVNADDQLTDRNEWLMKSLTEESTHRPSRKKHNMPTQQQKRKHQITYLAFQAKEREMDLKNQWALNSRTRRETQAKYGF